MKAKLLILILFFSLGTIVTFESCKKNKDCPEGTWDNYNDCMDAVRAAGSDCDCETEGATGQWFAVYDP